MTRTTVPLTCRSPASSPGIFIVIVTFAPGFGSAAATIITPTSERSRLMPMITSPLVSIFIGNQMACRGARRFSSLTVVPVYQGCYLARPISSSRCCRKSSLLIGGYFASSPSGTQLSSTSRVTSRCGCTKKGIE